MYGIIAIGVHESLSYGWCELAVGMDALNHQRHGDTVI